MEFPIKLHTTKQRWPIIYMEMSQVMLSKTNIIFCLCKQLDNDEKQHYAAFHLGFTVAKIPVDGLPVCKGLIARARKRN